jgi:STE24 endopeptidase
MQFSLIVAVLAALVISENGLQQPVDSTWWRVGLVFCGMLVTPALAAVIATRTARRLQADFAQRRELLRRCRRLRRFHTICWLVLSVAMLYGLDWAQIVRFNWRLDHVILLEDVVVLVPVLVPLILSWAAFYEVDRALQVAGGWTADSETTTRGQFVVLQLRHCLGMLLLPVLGLSAIQDMAELFFPGVLKGDYALLVYVPPLVLLFAFFPTMLRYVWQTFPLAAGSLHDRLQDAARRAGFRCRRILVWETNGTLVNAAVAGFLPPLRYVFLTDGLLTQLTEEEIEAVFGHEVGHIRHRHLPLRIVAMAVPVSLWLLVDQVFPQAAGRVEHWLAQGGLRTQVPLALLMLAGMASYGLVVFGSYSRLLEGQADLFGCHTLGVNGETRSVDTFVSALEKLAASGGIDRHAAGWQHASIARRVAFLYRAADDPLYERRFHRRVHLLSALMVAITLSPVVYVLLQ